MLVGTQKDADIEEPAGADLYTICVEGEVVRIVKAAEPKRLICRACSFIFYQDPKVVAESTAKASGPAGAGACCASERDAPALGVAVAPANVNCGQ